MKQHHFEQPGPKDSQLKQGVLEEKEKQLALELMAKYNLGGLQ